MTRKTYPKEFKEQLIKEAMEIGNVGQVAKRHEISPKALYRWISQSKHKAWQHTNGDAKKTTVYVPSHQEFKQLEKLTLNNKPTMDPNVKTRFFKFKATLGTVLT